MESAATLKVPQNIEMIRLFGEHVDIGALVWANAGKYDFYVLVESDVRIPVFKPQPRQIRRARMLLALLKKTGQEAKR